VKVYTNKVKGYNNITKLYKFFLYNLVIKSLRPCSLLCESRLPSVLSLLPSLSRFHNQNLCKSA